MSDLIGPDGRTWEFYEIDSDGIGIRPKEGINLYLLVTWLDGQPNQKSFTDESDAIEAVKDALPHHDKVYLFVTDATGVIVLSEIDTKVW